MRWQQQQHKKHWGYVISSARGVFSHQYRRSSSDKRCMITSAVTNVCHGLCLSHSKLFAGSEEDTIIGVLLACYNAALAAFTSTFEKTRIWWLVWTKPESITTLITLCCVQILGCTTSLCKSVYTSSFLNFMYSNYPVAYISTTPSIVYIYTRVRSWELKFIYSNSWASQDAARKITVRRNQSRD